MAAWVRMKYSPSPLRSASNMPLSTSVKSRMIAPLLSSSRTASFGPMAQATTSLSDGNAVPQGASRSSLKPPAPASSAKLTAQVRSRAALEISQAPTIALAASLTGVCAGAAPTDATSVSRAKPT